jgi:hypothetical protein
VRQRPLLLLLNLLIASILVIPCLVSAPHCSFKSRPYNSWCALLLILNKIIKCEVLIMGVQQLEYILSIIHTNVCACLNILQLGAMTCAEQCKLRQHKSRNDYNFKSYSFKHFVCKTTQHTSVALALNGLWTVVRQKTSGCYCITHFFKNVISTYAWSLTVTSP